jgi:hypothetical protein
MLTVSTPSQALPSYHMIGCELGKRGGGQNLWVYGFDLENRTLQVHVFTNGGYENRPEQAGKIVKSKFKYTGFISLTGHYSLTLEDGRFFDGELPDQTDPLGSGRLVDLRDETRTMEFTTCRWF